MTTTTARLQSQGYTCRLETVTGQGYLGGDGVTCYRVRRPDGTLAIYAVSTYRTARQAWAEAARLAGIGTNFVANPYSGPWARKSRD